MASEAARKNQPPPKLIIPFQTRPIIELGTSNRQNRSHLVSRNIRAASSSSGGWVIKEWYMLKVMFHAWEVKMAKIEANSRPSTEPGNKAMKKVMVTVKNPRMGTDCKMSRSGMSTTRARRLRAAAVAYTKVNNTETNRA